MESCTDNVCFGIGENLAQDVIELLVFTKRNHVDYEAFVLTGNLQQSGSRWLLPSVHLRSPFSIDTDVFLVKQYLKCLELVGSADELDEGIVRHPMVVLWWMRDGLEQIRDWLYVLILVVLVRANIPADLNGIWRACRILKIFLLKLVSLV